jgi:hypothetical protein
MEPSRKHAARRSTLVEVYYDTLLYTQTQFTEDDISDESRTESVDILVFVQVLCTVIRTSVS